MPSFLGQFTVTAGADTPIEVGQGGLSAVLIGNESGLTLIIRMGSSYSRSLYPGTVDKFDVPSGFTGVVIVSAKTAMVVGNTSSYPASYVQADAVGLGEKIDGIYPMALPRAAITPTASGNPIFSATFGVGSAAGTIQSLNVFNPQNSGVSYQFHSARAFNSDGTLGNTCELRLVSGADLNLPNAVPTVSHDCGVNPPVSLAHCTAQDDGNGHGGTQIEVLDTQAGVTADILSFPDQIILRPGNNLRIAIPGKVGIVVRFTLKWTEVPQVVPGAGTGGATTGNILTAASVVNQGNSVATGIILGQPAGDSNNATYIDNAGNATFGDAAHAGRVTIIGGGLTLPVGSFSKMSTFTGSSAAGKVTVNHNLGDVPDAVFLIFSGLSSTPVATTIGYNSATLTTTQVDVWSSINGVGFIGFAFKK